jgi:hypothetical protein
MIQVKEDEMGTTCSSHGEKMNTPKVLVETPRRKETTKKI